VTLGRLRKLLIFLIFFIFLSLINIYLHGLPEVWIVAVSATVEGT